MIALEVDLKNGHVTNVGKCKTSELRCGLPVIRCYHNCPPFVPGAADVFCVNVSWKWMTWRHCIMVDRELDQFLCRNALTQPGIAS